MDNQEIPLPTTLIQHIHPESRITVQPWQNANTYTVLISHPSWSGDLQGLFRSTLGGAATGTAKAAGRKTLSWASVKALGFVAVKAMSVIVGAAVGAVAPVKGGTMRQVLELKSGGLTALYFVSKGWKP
jgi:hypothetical protein